MHVFLTKIVFKQNDQLESIANHKHVNCKLNKVDVHDSVNIQLTLDNGSYGILNIFYHSKYFIANSKDIAYDSNQNTSITARDYITIDR